MAENDSAERTEQPTAKKLADARRKGQVPRSVDLGAAAVSIAAAAAILLFGQNIASSLATVMKAGLSVSRADLESPDFVVRSFALETFHALLAILPILAITLLAAVLAPAIIGGWNFSGEALTPKFERLSPIKGVGRMFSARSVIELLKSLAKFIFVGGVGIWVVWSQSDRLVQLARESVASGIISTASIAAFATLAMAASLVLVAFIDAPFQLWKFTREMRMSREEIKKEFKESDGSPETRSRIRSVQAALARGRMMQDVPEATVVVTNPTHFAVALRYQEGRDAAPIVVAKGADEIAAKIRELAAGSKVPLVSAPPLARALFRYVDIGREIPAPLYVAVARVLTYIWQVRAAIELGLDKPTLPVIEPEIEFFDSKAGVR